MRILRVLEMLLNASPENLTWITLILFIVVLCQRKS